MTSNAKRGVSAVLGGSSNESSVSSGLQSSSLTLSKKPRGPRKKLVWEDQHTIDELHNAISMEPVLKAFVDTPQFQRLRSLNQLGTSSLVFMNANHSRFEHSLGVADLAQRVVKEIQNKQPNLPCTSKDVLCVKLAGLLHDIGHGPFSHVYEVFCSQAFPRHFQTLTNEEKKAYDGFDMSGSKSFKHEQVSLMMIDAALAHLGLEVDLQNMDQPLKEIPGVGSRGLDATSFRCFDAEDDDENAIIRTRDIVFIKELIMGKPIGTQGFVGRPSWEYEWFYQIVANSGIDVDRLDYLSRDATRAGVGNGGKIEEAIVKGALVAWGPCLAGGCTLCVRKNWPEFGKHLMLCFKEKTVAALHGFFNCRYDLHERVYWHKTTRAAGHMVCDILCAADPYFELSTAPFVRSPGEESTKKKWIPISQAGRDPNAFLRLHDSIVHEIANSKTAALGPAAALAGRFLSRDLYKMAGQKFLADDNETDEGIWHLTEEEILQGLLEQDGLHTDENGKSIELKACDIIVDKFSIHHGKKEQDPMESIYVVSSGDLIKIRKELVTAKPLDLESRQALAPKTQQQRIVRVYCRNKEKRELLSHVWQGWLQNLQEAHNTTIQDGCFFGAVISQSTPVPAYGGRHDYRYKADEDSPSEACRKLDSSP